LGIIGFQFGSTLHGQCFPIAKFPIGDFPAFGILDAWELNIFGIGRLRHFVCHLQEEQISNLLQVIPIANSIIPEHICEIPDF
jgi:hypothetical protein